MAVVRPFRGFRYALDVDLRAVLAPPYDVMSAAQVAGLAARSPYNAVHVDVPVPPGSAPTDEAYAAAAATFKQWRAGGTLLRDERPAAYLLEQTFDGPDGREHTRRGFLARLRLADFSERVVLPHEHTHAGPKQDRLRLYRAAHADVSPIFLLYPDDDDRVAAELERGQATLAPAAWREAVTDDGTRQRVAVLDGDAATRLTAALDDQALYIADGHHRYETALAYRDERRAAGDHSADTMMVYLCGMSGGLEIFPTHRLVRGLVLPSDEVLRERLAPLFEITDRATGRAAGEALVAALPDAPDPAGSFALYLADRDECLAVRLSDPGAPARLEARGVTPWASRLSVTILHELLLHDVLGVDAGEGRIDYASSTADAFDRMPTGAYSLAAFLNATSVQDVRDIADHDEVMPQKSTYFYPKLPVGLVYDALDD
jgi:uncharacterized protein (DUF1015 family)